MKANRIVRAGLLVAGVAAACLGGCAEPRQAGSREEPIFYPGAPETPRVQFLMSFSDAEQWRSQGGSSFRDFIVGKPQSAPGEIKSPYGLACRDGKLYVCDLGIRQVHVIDFANRRYGTLGRPGELENPVNITIAPDGTRYVCDTGKRQVAVYDSADRFVRYLGDPQTCVPHDLAVAEQNLYVLDIRQAEVEIWSRDGQVLGSFAGKGTAPGQLTMPTNLALDAKGQVFVADTFQSIVNVYDAQGRFLRTIGGPGDRPGFFARPKGLDIDPAGRVWVADAQWEVVQAFQNDGRPLIYFGGAGDQPHSMGMPAGMAIDATSLEHFRPLIHDALQAEYLLFVANQFGQRKIGVYAFGNADKE